MSVTTRGVVVVVACASFAFAACESAANLDVTYANVTSDGSVDAPQQVLGPSCGCDTTQGEGCCVRANALPFCTTSLEQCADGGGAWMECFGPSADSDCCWHFGVGGKGSAATFRGECDGGARVCTTSSECGDDGGACSTAQCGQLELGACGANKPSCP
ncbi:MAG TPA: hypothetical protein VIF62_10845 [Labilithrix sp.]|jgi:hypothetical protein